MGNERAFHPLHRTADIRGPATAGKCRPRHPRFEPRNRRIRSNDPAVNANARQTTILFRVSPKRLEISLARAPKTWSQKWGSREGRDSRLDLDAAITRSFSRGILRLSDIMLTVTTSSIPETGILGHFSLHEKDYRVSRMYLDKVLLFNSRTSGSIIYTSYAIPWIHPNILVFVLEGEGRAVLCMTQSFSFHLCTSYRNLYRHQFYSLFHPRSLLSHIRLNQ